MKISYYLQVPHGNHFIFRWPWRHARTLSRAAGHHGPRYCYLSPYLRGPSTFSDLAAQGPFKSSTRKTQCHQKWPSPIGMPPAPQKPYQTAPTLPSCAECGLTDPPASLHPPNPGSKVHAGTHTLRSQMERSIWAPELWEPQQGGPSLFLHPLNPCRDALCEDLTCSYGYGGPRSGCKWVVLSPGLHCTRNSLRSA